MANAPSTKILPLTIRPATLSVGFPLKQPLKISSNSTAAVEFSTTDRELQQIFNCNQTISLPILTN